MKNKNWSWQSWAIFFSCLSLIFLAFVFRGTLGSVIIGFVGAYILFSGFRKNKDSPKEYSLILWLAGRTNFFRKTGYYWVVPHLMDARVYRMDYIQHTYTFSDIVVSDGVPVTFEVTATYIPDEKRLGEFDDAGGTSAHKNESGGEFYDNLKAIVAVQIHRLAKTSEALKLHREPDTFLPDLQKQINARCNGVVPEDTNQHDDLRGYGVNVSKINFVARLSIELREKLERVYLEGLEKAAEILDEDAILQMAQKLHDEYKNKDADSKITLQECIAEVRASRDRREGRTRITQILGLNKGLPIFNVSETTEQ